MSRQKKRQLSFEERDLWGRVTKTIAPIQSNYYSSSEIDDLLEEFQKPPSPAPSNLAAKRSQKLPVINPPYQAKLNSQKPLPLLVSPLDLKSRRKLKRGQERLSATLDLHGYSQSEAHTRLLQFLSQAQSNDARFVLVITGKGKRANSETGAKGILRRMVPNWLSDPTARHLVASFDEAHIGHGGEGALYVRLRRKRSKV